MSYQYITAEREDHLYIVTINRPDVMNALNPQTHAEMAQAFDEFEQDPELWVAIVTGAGIPHSAPAGTSLRWSTRKPRTTTKCPKAATAA